MAVKGKIKTKEKKSIIKVTKKNSKAKTDKIKKISKEKKNSEINTQPKSEQALLKKIWEMAAVMSAAGIINTDYITQLTYLLFLKMDDEKEKLGLKSSILKGNKWQDLFDLSGQDLVDKYENILKELSKEDGIVGTIFTKANNKINQPTKLKQIIELLNKENWYMMQGDFKGAIYESILERIGQDTKSRAGEYFTPRSVINAIVDVIDPKVGEQIADIFTTRLIQWHKSECLKNVA